VSDGAAWPRENGNSGRQELIERAVWTGQVVGKRTKRTGKGPLRVVSRAKLVGNVTQRVSKADSRNGKIESWSHGVLQKTFDTNGPIYQLFL